MDRYDNRIANLFTLAWFTDRNGVVFATDPNEHGDTPWLMDYSFSDGTSNIIIRDGGSNPAVSPDGAYILFDRYLGPDQLMVLSSANGSLQPLIAITGDVPNAVDGDWSPDGRYITFMTTFGEGLGYGVRYEVMVARADGSEPGVVAEDGMHPDWSPDGASIVFEREDGLYVVEVSGGLVRKILDLPPLHRPPMPAWSP